ncbi:MAG: lipoyl protein ligase domain-containing protein [Moorellaceae bacterium]
MQAEWRLLDTGFRTAAENMALDEVLLLARSEGAIPDTLRFLQFDPPCVLVGYHQVVEQEVRLEFCHGHGIEVNRRLTGGGALYWDSLQLGWEIITTGDNPHLERKIERLYAQVCGAVARALVKLGVPAAYRPRNDIEVRGRKISGTGGTELHGALLYQGTLLVDFDVETMLKALRIPTEKLKAKEINSLKERVTCLKWELGRVPPWNTIKEAIAEELARELNMILVPGKLTEYEKALLAHRLPYFKSDEWIHAVRTPGDKLVLKAGRKTRGGFLRCSLVLSADKKRIEAVYFTGDFFVHPRRGIYDLEASLRGIEASVDAVTGAVQDFFRRSRVRLPGITVGDFTSVLRDALGKKDYPAWGIPADRVNDVSTVAGTLAEILVAPVVLLPYCAKLVSCRYRFRQGCSRCGRCDVGEAYRLALDYGLKPVTIQNYEMLSRVLRRLKSEGLPAFLGSCCEAFLVKHRRDFERIGLPGVLVDLDSSTCYELKQEGVAHAGRFENQTTLKLDLLELLMARLGPYRSGVTSTNI